VTLVRIGKTNKELYDRAKKSLKNQLVRAEAVVQHGPPLIDKYKSAYSSFLKVSKSNKNLTINFLDSISDSNPDLKKDMSFLSRFVKMDLSVKDLEDDVELIKT